LKDGDPGRPEVEDAKKKLAALNQPKGILALEMSVVSF
jgi:hypothetical protein